MTALRPHTPPLVPRQATTLGLLSIALLLGGCSSLQLPWPGGSLARTASLTPAAAVTSGPGDASARAAATPAAEQAPARWQSAMPHQGQLADLSRWWQRLQHPVLGQLIDAAQALSPSVAAAQSRLAQARASVGVADAALGPQLDASAAISRGKPQQAGGIALAGTGTVAQIGLQAGWEIDLFGGNRAVRQAAQARADGADAAWHDARVSVAADVAATYFSHLACGRQLALQREDLASREATRALLERSAQAGFAPDAQVALAGASAAEARARLAQQAAQCARDLKALTALTGWPEERLHRALAEAASLDLDAAAFRVPELPADALAQRPDIAAATREWQASRADLDATEAQRLPRLSLAGSLAAGQAWTGGATLDGQSWSLGPLTLTLPLFDGGRRQAQTAAARARQQEAASQLAARIRQAVREVEEALLDLDTSTRRQDDVAAAAEGYRRSLQSVQTRQRAGLASLVELEDARRLWLAAESARIDWARARALAWVSLYRAAGGGWSATASPGPA